MRVQMSRGALPRRSVAIWRNSARWACRSRPGKPTRSGTWNSKCSQRHGRRATAARRPPGYSLQRQGGGDRRRYDGPDSWEALRAGGEWEFPACRSPFPPGPCPQAPRDCSKGQLPALHASRHLPCRWEGHGSQSTTGIPRAPVTFPHPTQVLTLCRKVIGPPVRRPVLLEPSPDVVGGEPVLAWPLLGEVDLHA